jgi:hypothetical protein
MKKIEVSDEMYQALMDLSKEMTSQDMRCTKMPHMFQVRTEKQVAAYPGQGDEMWVSDEGDKLNGEDEIREFIVEYIYENDESIHHMDDTEAKVEAKMKVSEMDYSDLENYLEEEHPDNWCKVNVTTEHEYVNTFLTAKACEEHIKANDYHYKNPVCYLNHAWRNPEMELVSRFLCELSGGKLHE